MRVPYNKSEPKCPECTLVSERVILTESAKIEERANEFGCTNNAKRAISF